MLINEIKQKYPVNKPSSKKRRGDAFEDVTKWFLENDPRYAKRFLKIEKWKVWKHRDGGDTGIDLVGTEKDGTWCAIQCKFHQDKKDTVSQSEVKGLVAKAESLSKKHGRQINLLFVHSGADLSSNAEKMLNDSNCPVIGYYRFKESIIKDWRITKKFKKSIIPKLRSYQEEAIQKVLNGFKTDDRGQLIMACGTGKTLTSMKIAESQVNNGWVLYVVPSISLINQTLSYWSNNSDGLHYYIPVCSDSSIEVDDGSILDLPYSATTNISEIKRRMSAKKYNELGVIFCTYQSVTRLAGIKFDLIICDEAHRTTGIKDDTHFRVVHNNLKLPSKKRLYMTATPRVYRGDEDEKKGRFSMDNENDYGKKFFHYSFARAVKEGNLVNVGIRVPVVSEEDLERFVDESEEGYSEGTIDERILLAAVWHGLNYGTDHVGKEEQKQLLQRVIAFTNNIKSSKTFTGKYLGNDMTSDESRTTDEKMSVENGKIKIDRSFIKSVNDYEKKGILKTNNSAAVRHVDGTMNSSTRERKLEWLRESNKNKKECRILSNARCLSEGVDVPALDGIIFLQPRESKVDVIQAVGRVMRKAPGKEMGQIIVPIVKPKGMSLDESFKDKVNKPWRPLWEIINAIRSHDETMEAKLAKVGLGGDGIPPEFFENFEIIWMGSLKDEPQSELFGQLKTHMVDKIINNDYFDERAEELGSKSREISEMIKRSKNKKTIKVVDELTIGLQKIINDSIDRKSTIDVLAQHMALSKIFEALFPIKFRKGNPVSQALDHSVSKIGFKFELQPFLKYFDDVATEVSGLDPKRKQNYIKKVYESFQVGFDKKKAESHGIVYTPTEAADFIIHSTEELLRKNFKTGFNCSNVKILEPFCGTGTFITRLLHSKIISPAKMYDKFKNDIWANEISLLAYYIASVNIETEFEIMSKSSKRISFKNINYTDTLNLNPRFRTNPNAVKNQRKLVAGFERVDKRILKEKNAHIHVCIGNPPYSGGQKLFDDQNPNLSYPHLDDIIETTYGKGVRGKAKGKLRDSYIRSIRWMSDRISDSGVIGIITNGSFIRSDSTRGMRAALKNEFDEIWILDLRGNQRTKGEDSKKEGGKIFGSGSRAPVTIAFFVKKPNKHKTEKNDAVIYYKDIGDYLSRDQKIKKIVKWKSISNITGWKIIEPDTHEDWVNQRNNEFYGYTPIGSKDVKSGKTDDAIFKEYSLGVVTNRDTWAVNSSKTVLESNMRTHIDYYNKMNPKMLKLNSKQGKWSGDLSVKRIKKGKQKFDKNKITEVLYSPFFKQYLYFDRIFNNSVYRIPSFYSTSENNLLICYGFRADIGQFSSFITDTVGVGGLFTPVPTQYFPLYTFKDGNKKENILDETLKTYKKYYNNSKITKKDIFYYVYGILHHPGYKTKYLNTLTRDLARIPMAPNFEKIKDIGKKLAKLHLEYETGNRVKLNRKFKPQKKFNKLTWGRKKVMLNGKNKSISDKTVLRLDGKILYEHLPKTTYEVNGRSPLGWIVERYQVSKNEESGIINDPCSSIDLCSVIERVVYVAVESDRLISKLPPVFEPKNWKPKKKGMDNFIETKSYDTRIDG